MWDEFVKADEFKIARNILLINEEGLFITSEVIDGFKRRNINFYGWLKK